MSDQKNAQDVVLTETADVNQAVSQLSVDRVVEQIESAIKNEKISVMNILTVCISAMQIVETFPNLKGEQKKEVVLKAVENILKRQEGDVQILSILPSFIDKAVSLDKGVVTISLDTKNLTSCCGFC